MPLLSVAYVLGLILKTKKWNTTKQSLQYGHGRISVLADIFIR
jgi:hypothetical protein